MTRWGHDGDSDSEQGASCRDGQTRAPALLDVLVARTAEPTIVADPSSPRLTTILANAAAWKRLITLEATGTLRDWVKEAGVRSIRMAIDQGDLEGTVDGWHWHVTELEGRQWLLCHPVSPPPDDVAAHPDTATRDRRLIAAHEAALAVNSHLELESVLQRIVDVARDVVSARYAALGVADEQGRIRQFITSGITPEQRAAIGPLPEGHGLLGALISEGKPLLIPDIAADPRSSGFPPHHPTMRTLLGVPITLDDRVLGDLYLTEHTSGTPFTREDLETLEFLSAHAARAIERAQLHGTIREGRQRAEFQRDHLQAVLDNLPSAVIITLPPDGEVELANAAALQLIFGDHASPDVVLHHVEEFRLLEPNGTPLPHALRPAVRALSDMIVRNQQLLLESKDGLRIPVLTQATPLYDAHGNVARTVIVFQEITRLREAEQLKDDFLALVSHEFRTPLTSIHGGAHLLANGRDVLDEATREELLNDIAVESDRLDRMLHNMLSLAAIMAGRLTPATEPVLVAPLVQAVLDEVAHRSPSHAFMLDISADLPAIEADPDLLSQVLRNLFENAVKYAPDGGDIRTTAELEGQIVTIHIRDEGIGIAPEHVESVFERFRRPGADPTVRGMGLGLYLSRHLVEAQGGRIRAGSNGPGTGSTFSITFPVAHGWASTSGDEDGG